MERLENRSLLASDLQAALGSEPQGIRGEGESSTVYTWSIAKDGTPVSVSGKPGTQASNLQATLDGIYRSRSNWEPVFKAALKVWDDVAGVSFVAEAADDGAALPESPEEAGRRGRIRFAGVSIDKAGGVLAEANSGDDVVIDTEFGSGEAFLKQLYVVLVHEIGHVLGLEHVVIARPLSPNTPNSVMQATLGSLESLDLQRDDILQAQLRHGDNYEPNDTLETAHSIDRLLPGVNTLDNLSLQSRTDVDVFKLNAARGRALTLRVVPDNDSYQRGPDALHLVTYDPQRQNQLSVEIRSADGQFRASATALVLGDSAVIEDFVIPEDGVYYVRVTGGNSNSIQGYRLAIEDELAPSIDPRAIEGNIQQLRSDFDAARNAGQPVTIQLQRGTYKFEEPIRVSGNVILQGLGSDATILDGQELTQLFVVERGATFKLLDLAITRGRALTLDSPQLGGAILGFEMTLWLTNVVLSDNRARSRGGAIYVSGSELQLNNVTAVYNHADGDDPDANGNRFGEGGAVYVDRSTVTITDCRFSENSSPFGGALGSNSSMVIKNSQFTNNRASQQGGAISNGEEGTTLLLSNSWISGNSAYEGGGLNLGKGLHQITNVRIEGNIATRGGGGIRVQQNGTLEVSDSLIANNRAQFGAGVHLDFNFSPSFIRTSWIRNNVALLISGGVNIWGELRIEQSTISENVAQDWYGGGIGMSQFNSTLLMINSTVSRNQSLGQGAGVFVYASATANFVNSTIAANRFLTPGFAGGAGLHVGPFGAAALTNTLIAQNGEGESSTDVIGPITVSHSLLGAVDRETFQTHNNNGNILGVAGNEVDARLDVLADNLGPTPTHRLFADSPAIDAAIAIEGLVLDQINSPRRRPDIGAFELPKLEPTRGLPPTLDPIDDLAPISNLAGERTVELRNITDPNDAQAPLSIAAVSSNLSIIRNLTVTPTTAGRAELKFTPVPNSQGSATVRVTVSGQGSDRRFGSADDTFTERSFTVTVVNGFIIEAESAGGTPVTRTQASAGNSLPVASGQRLTYPFALSSPATLNQIQLRYSLASVSPSASVQLLVDGQSVGSRVFTATGNGNTFAIVSWNMETALTAGTHSLELVTSGTITALELDQLAGSFASIPVLSVESAVILEPRSRTDFMRFRLTLSQVSSTPVSVRVQTRPDSAESGVDFTPVDEIITFAPGVKTMEIAVPILVDSPANITTLEPTETFSLELSEVVGATLATTSAIGVIYDAPIVIGNPILPTIREQPKSVPIIFVNITPVGPTTPTPRIVRITTPVKSARLLASIFALADTTRDGNITALDALLVINALNTIVPVQGSNIAANFRSSIVSFDVNRDGFVSPLDALLIINELNQQA